jgi:hypothetical protein
MPMLLKNRLPDWFVLKGVDRPFIIIPFVSLQHTTVKQCLYTTLF